LYRPEEFLGRAWQCSTCGPTVVSEMAEEVSEELAALLEKEYQLGLLQPLAISTIPRSDARVQAKPRARRRVVAALLLTLALIPALLTLCLYLSLDLPLLAALVISAGVFIVSLVGIRVYVMNALQRRRTHENLPAQRRWAAPTHRYPRYRPID
jgi:small-conductance mechanosensitive channel